MRGTLRALSSADELDVFPVMTCDQRHGSKGNGSHPDEGPPMLKPAQVIEKIYGVLRISLRNLSWARYFPCFSVVLEPREVWTSQTLRGMTITWGIKLKGNVWYLLGKSSSNSQCTLVGAARGASWVPMECLFRRVLAEECFRPLSLGDMLDQWNVPEAEVTRWCQDGRLQVAL
ncbi:hypothetical protein F511_09630 [Dorcoceras hygrometricum]|uniref:Uncharacterized protein n=1 Tax=Dorcoceras hygrometricum TaxID=472368 RepID=A0A2Z7D7K1_9LAMI|nr:hypothetical protein F511_09630 [Dorcoceras hygrometricum]